MFGPLPEDSIGEKREKYKEIVFCVIIPIHYEQVINCDIFTLLLVAVVAVACFS